MTKYFQLLAQREELDKVIEDAYREEAAKAIADVRQTIADYGLTAEECGFPTNRKIASVPPSVKSKNRLAKTAYAGPSGESWIGMGRRPLWLTKLCPNGEFSKYAIPSSQGPSA